MNIPVKLLAPAKLTLSLQILGRASNGYHLIEAEMVSLDLMDELLLKEPNQPNQQIQISLVGEQIEGVPQGSANLVSQALELVGHTASVEIKKAIPPGAGLGGGSADAAAILHWAGLEDPKLAASIGADVAFCLKGGRAKVSGMGEKIQPLEFEEAVYTLLIPPFGCLTADVYAAWDELGGPKGEAGNDLEPAALKVAPELAIWRDKLAEVSGQRPRLAGSGSTWFVEGQIEAQMPELLTVRTTPAR